MPTQLLFNIQLVLGYVVWLLCVRTYVQPRLKAMSPRDAHRAIAMLHSFRFFGLVFVVPGVVGRNLPAEFATFAAYGDLVTGVLAIGALLTRRTRRLFWAFVVGFNVAGVVDLLVDYYHAVRLGLGDIAGELGATYAIPILYVPLLMITHVLAFSLLLRRPPEEAKHAGREASSQ